MSQQCLELYVFTVKDSKKARRARLAAQGFVERYEGLLSWSAYRSLEDSNLFADLVLWHDAACAKAASTRLKHDPQFARLLAEIDGLLTISQFQLDRHVEASATAA